MQFKGVIQFANVICDFRSFEEKAFKQISGNGRTRRHVVATGVKDDASKDMFPAYRKKSLADKRARFQCRMTFVVFGEKLEDCSFNFEGKYDT